MTRNSRFLRWALFAGLIIMIWLFFAFDLDAYLSFEVLRAHRAQWLVWIDAHFGLAALMFFMVYVVAAALSLPGAAVLTVAGGALFGTLYGIVLVSFASSFGACLAFLSSRFLFRDFVRARFGQHFFAFDQGISKQGAFYLFTLRLIPAFPFFMVNLLMGLTSLRLRTFYWVTQLGTLPVTCALIYVGTHLATIHAIQDVLTPSFIGALFVLALLPVIAKAVTRYLNHRQIYRPHLKPKRFDYNLIVIGAGAGGLVSAYIASTMKAKVALIEKHKMGGDCLNSGCVPSKTILHAARLMAEAHDGAQYGLGSVQAPLDFAQLMDHVRAVIVKIEPHDSVARYRELGVECLQGEARVISPWEVAVDGRRLSAKNLMIATGAKPFVPDLPGLEQIAYLTSDNLWDLQVLPRRLLVLGGGAIGCEMALAFRRLGSDVVLVEKQDHLLPQEDVEATACIEKAFEREGILVLTGQQALRIEHNKEEKKLICRSFNEDGHEIESAYAFDHILIALGRKPNVAGFGLEQLGLELNERGAISADGYMRTNFPNISVCGDVAGPYALTHVAAHQAWHAVVNALIAPFWRFRVDYRFIPWIIFTDPEFARVGLSEAEARAQNIEYEVTRYSMAELDRAIIENKPEGMIKVLTIAGSDQILGVTLVGLSAGERIAVWVMAMKYKIGLNKILSTPHAYPSLMEANKYVAGNWKRAHAPTWAFKLSKRIMNWRRL
jgi:pyruvate/2-oxoglutarate dehydrogenase complex dihydrolipoamide dehydrogenase (E3) component/uncharacterized membrane protein YdjX (TVP38/TMEM64 family)